MSEETTVERVALLPADLKEAWEAVGEPEGLERWLADEAKFEPEEGSPARFVIGDEVREGVITRIEPDRAFAFEWVDGQGGRSTVEIELTPCVSGTRIVVTETAQQGPVALGSRQMERRLFGLLDRCAAYAVR